MTARLPVIERPRFLTRSPLRRIDSPTDGAVALQVESLGDEPWIGRWTAEVSDEVRVYATEGRTRYPSDDEAAWVANLAIRQLALGEYTEEDGPIGVRLDGGRLVLDGGR